QVAGRNVGLNATRAARRLYRSLNFVREALVFQCQGEAVSPPDLELPSGAVIRALEAGDLFQRVAHEPLPGAICLKKRR
ncbi:hypothetical protein ACC697_39620, partial [Rhizobium ruizarguesonis]